MFTLDESKKAQMHEPDMDLIPGIRDEGKHDDSLIDLPSFFIGILCGALGVVMVIVI